MKTNTKKYLCYVLCVFIGFIARLFYIIKYPVLSRDAYFYCDMIENWRKAMETQGQMPPFSVFLMGIPYWVFHYDISKGAILCNMVFGLITIIVFTKIIYQMTHSLYLTTLLGMIVGTHPRLIKYSGEMLRESTFMCFLALCLLFLISYFKKNRIKDVVTSGIYAGCAFACRFEGIELLVLCACAIAVLNDHTSTMKRVKSITVFLVSFSCALVFIFVSIGVKPAYLAGYKAAYFSKTQK